ncbi:nuclear transport factor 2 family protein [Cyanobium sp. NIES-981]|uniref:nuclear transport factor 2 family protein n=1 Tax=Cyanobium sp. NIES-981 TaxID=1851505 RepID=UPI0018D4AB25|nr:nuclear transport factor 2 family protein [Cyanobium sp. NIES-981]
MHMINTQPDINRAEQALREAMLASDVSILDDLIDDQLLFIGPDGSVLSKEGDLGLYRTEAQHLTTIDFQETRVRLLGGMAFVTASAFVSGVFKGSAFAGNFRYLRVWHQTPTGWRVVAGSVHALGSS